MSKTKRESLYIVLFSALLMWVCYSDLQQLLLPHVLSDEYGYWSAGAYFAGYNWSGVSSQSAYYSYGYGLLLTPLFWIFDDIMNMHLAALLLNGLFLILSMIIAYRIAVKYLLGGDRLLGFLCAAISVIYPNTIAQTNTTHCESLLILLTWLTIYGAFSLAENYRFLKLEALSILTVYMYFVHQRMLGVLIAWIICMIYLFCAKKTKVRHFLFAFGTVVVLFLLGNAVKALFQAQIWGESEYLHANDYSGQFAKIKNIFSSIDAFAGFFAVAAGQVLGVIVSSSFLLVFGVLCVAAVIFDAYIQKKSSNIFSDASRWPYLFILFAGVFSLGISAVFMSDPDRLDMVYYGRYVEAVVPPLLLLGSIYVFRKIQMGQIKHILLTSCITLWLCLFAAILLGHFTSAKGLTIFNPNNSVGMYFFFENGAINFPKAFLAVVLSFSCVVLAAYFRTKQEKHLLWVLFLVVPLVFNVSMAKKTMDNTNFQSSYGTSIIEASQDIREMGDVPIYVLQQDGYGHIRNRDRLQYLLYDREVHVVGQDELLDIDKGVVVTNAETSLTFYTEMAKFGTHIGDYKDSVSIFSRDIHRETDGVVHIPLSAFASQLDEERVGDSIVSNGNAGFLLYGPYKKLESGTYRVEIMGTISEGQFEADSFFDITYASGNSCVAKVDNLQTFVDGESFSLAVEFEMRESATDCEFRLYINAGVYCSITDAVLMAA